MLAQSSDPPPERCTFDAFAYALLRLVPRVERGERINIGVVIFCRERAFLDARFELDERRALALFPDIDLGAVRCHLDFVRLVCAGDPAGGPVAELVQPERFGWLVSPTSTVVQPSRVHTGLCADPAKVLEGLLESMVRLRGDKRLPASRRSHDDR